MIEYMSFKAQCAVLAWLQRDHGQQGYVRKETKWATSSPRLAALLSGQCSGDHRHAHLIGKRRAAAAAVYPPKLVEKVLRDFKRLMVDDGKADHVSLYAAGPMADFPELGLGHVA